MYELALARGKVIEVYQEYPDITFIKVEIPGEEPTRAVNYNQFTGMVKEGDEVILNTTAVRLGLGTGGYHFVYFNLTGLAGGEMGFFPPGQGDSALDKPLGSAGHIMKLRYTPLQSSTLAVEEEESPYHELIKDFESLEASPVVILPLHSLLAPLLIAYKGFYPDKKAVYIMTDGACLALDFSNLVRKLQAEGFLDATITYGNAFGGDYETVNIFTALATARKVLAADLIVVGMGPGIVGTGTKYGFSGVENAFIAKAVRILEGRSILIPRISFAEKRSRHYGISHHTLTLLGDLITEPVEVVFPEEALIREIVARSKLAEKHDLAFYPIEEVKEILQASAFPFHSMGRGLAEDPLFFITAGLAVYKLEEENEEENCNGSG